MAAVSSSPSPSSWFAVVVVPVVVLWRLYWANRLPISDCDEVYNYWEPLHHVLFGDEGGGGGSLQTWEYAPEYSLRTYAYLEPLRLWAKHVVGPLLRYSPGHFRTLLWTLLTDLPAVESSSAGPLLFAVLRATIALSTAIAELAWLNAVSDRVSTRVALATALALVACSGPTHAAAAFLPSATWYATYCLASASLLRHNHRAFAAVAVTATLATGWPFGALGLSPLGLRVLYKEWSGIGAGKGEGGIPALRKILLWTLGVTLMIQAIVLRIDGYYYHDDPTMWWRQPVSATFNIFKYNALGNKDALYGVEPLSFYLKNLLLNLNVVAPLGIGALVVYGFSQRVQWDVWTILTPLLPWMLVTFPRPHKEERFLFPLYPLWCLSAALFVDATLNAVGRVGAGLSRHKALAPRLRNMLESIVFWIPVALFGLSRTLALSKYYTAPLYAYAALSALGRQSTDRVCTCGEWYRFPSSFFLGPSSPPLGALPSSFDGQLPQPFTAKGSRPSSRHLLHQPPFNDDNRGDPDRFAQLSECDWVVELEGGDCRIALPPNRIVYRKPFLNAAETSSTLHRVLYIPLLHDRAVQQGKVVYQYYVVYQMRK